MTDSAYLFNLALQHHRAANLPAAEQLYRQILQANAGHADSYHLLGVLAYQQGRFDEALSSIGHALALNPSAVYHTNLGLVHDALGQLKSAVADYRQALRLDPRAAGAHNNLGNVLQRLGKLAEAESHCRQALQLQPDYPEASNNLGNALLDQGKGDDAVAAFHQALRMRPHYPEACNNLGNAYERRHQLDEAVHWYRRAVELDPNSAGAWYNLGAALERQNKFDEAMASYRAAIRLQPQFVQAYNNMGVTCKRRDKLDEAVRWYQQALSLKPNYAEAHTNLGNVRRDQEQYTEALICYERALQCEPDSAEAHFNRALVWLLQGEWEQGWPEYEWRWRTSAFPRQDAPQPRWDGSALAGRTILVYAEQGLGDTLQFIRYLPLVKARGGKVILQCQAPLLRLLTRNAGVDQWAPQGHPLPPFDLQVPLLSLPGLFKTTMNAIPAAVPYLHADPGLVEKWQRELAPLGGFKVGIAWQGNPANPGDFKRSPPLEQFARLAEIEGVRLISLQKGPGEDQLRRLGSRFAVVDLGNHLDEAAGPFMDTAAVMMNLDLVITSDTSVPHLAGALGAPVWTVLPLVPDWRWLLQREDNPWYPTMRLFRQMNAGNWDEVFKRVAHELATVARH